MKKFLFILSTILAVNAQAATRKHVNKVAPVAVVVSSSSVVERTENKVVEIHMRTTPVDVMAEIQKKKTRKLETLPFRYGTCYGSFINNAGDIITARHCVDGFDEFEVQTADQRYYRAVVVATSSIHDLALIHIDRRNTEFFKIADTVQRGEKIFVLGSPLGITDTLATGVVGKIAGDALLMDCSALPGNSGGPVYNTKHELVGVVNASYTVGLGVTHLNRAVAVDAIHFFLKKVEASR